MAFEDAQARDIRATLAISWDEARTGSSRVVNLPGGRAVAVAIPAGIQHGAELRLAGQGDAGAPGARPGDLILRVSVISPQRVAERRWDDPALPTESIAPSSWSSSATQTPTEYVPPGSFFPAIYDPAASPTEAVGGVYPSSSVRFPDESYPRAYPAYEAASQSVYGMYPAREPAVLRDPRKRSGVVTFLIILIILVLIAGSASVFYLGYYQPNQVHVALTQTAQAQATSANQALRGTAAAAASSTAQTQATVQARQSLYAQVTSRTPTLSDAMSGQSSSQWEVLTSPEHGTCGFSGGSYHATMPQANFFQPCFATVPTFSNFAFQVQMTIVQGDEGGILFRANEASDQFYLFSLGADGSYQLYLYVNNQGAQAHLLLKGSSSPVQSQANEITVIAQGRDLFFYRNKQYLVSISDQTYSTGMIGVFGESQNQPTDASFQKIKVWAL